jgi:hypothetical protein
MNFSIFKLAVAKQFEHMSKLNLFRVEVDKDLLYSTYLSSFPNGSNLLYRERTEHDCSCCRQFIKTMGGVVAILNGKVISLWDLTMPGEPAYQAVADAMAKLVKAQPIDNVFLHYEKTAGTDRNFEELIGSVKTWEHFFVNIPKQFMMASKDTGTLLGEHRAVHDVLLRSLMELTDESIATVLELIAQNSLYRGEEHKFAVETFRELKRAFNQTAAEQCDAFVWLNIKAVPASVSRIRNTVVGSLLTDLSEGKELEAAVSAFEAKVAPTNYKRPTALITKAMVEKAKQQLADLGLTSALDRRYATINDITINNILFANREARKVINGDVFDELAATTGTKIKNLDKIEEVSIDRFITEILPRAESLEVMMENQHAGNLVSLIAPSDPTAGRLFKWDNNFSWSYNGELADSIKERVKKAGGNVSGDLCCRLAWFNYDDLDFHMVEPGGYEIHFGNRFYTSPNGGRLDVDMNAGIGQTREAVENIFYASKSTMKEGIYTLAVHNFCKRETKDVGFEVEIDFMGDSHHFAYDKAVPNRSLIIVAKFKYSKINGIEFIESLPSSKAVRTNWGVPTSTFHKVNVVMMSPNHWDDKAVGNKHYFFMLDSCVNDGTARGFFNEFLKEELNPHRKVFEMVGSKMTVADSPNQLSGIGFSSTQKNALICRVKGSFSRVVKIVF